MPQDFLTLPRHPRLTEIVELAETCVGVPFRPGKYSMHGMDCIGLIVIIVQGLKMYEPKELEVPKYNAVPTPGSMLKHLRKYLKRVDGPMHGGIVTYAQRGTGLYHVTVLGDRYMYHAAMENKKVVKVTLSPACLTNRRVCFSFDRPDPLPMSNTMESPLTVGGGGCF